MRCQTTQSGGKSGAVSGTCVTKTVYFKLYLYCICYVFVIKYGETHEMSDNTVTRSGGKSGAGVSGTCVTKTISAPDQSTTYLLLFQTTDHTSPDENKQTDQDKRQEHFSRNQSLPI